MRRAQRLTPVVSIHNRYDVSDRGSDSLIDLSGQEQMVFMPSYPTQGLDDEPVVAEIAQRHGASPRQVALAWMIARPPVIRAIPGTGSAPHVEANVAAAGLHLNAEDVAAITALRRTEA